MNHEDLLKEIERLRLRVSESEDTQVRLASKEQALRDSEERFRLLYDNTPCGYQSLDEGGRILEVNPAWVKTLGYSREEVLGRWFGDFLTPAYVEQFRENFPKFEVAGEFHRIELDMIRNDGSTISVALDGQIGRDQSGRFKQMHCIIHDLTEPKRSRQELEERRERLSLALDGASLGIWDWDLTAGRAYWTARTLGMLGYEANEFEPNLKNWKKLVHPEDWPRVSENLNLHLEGKEPVFLAEYRIMNKGRQWQWVQARGKVLEFGADGKPVRMAGVVVDVTEQKRAEDELRHSEEQYRTLVEESFDGIFVQKGAKIAFANSRLYEMLGYDKGELEGLDHWLVYHPDYQAITRERSQARMRGEDVPIQYEVRLQGKDGSSFQGEIRARAISLNGEAGVQVWVRDISERMQTEKRLRDSERKYRELVEHANSIILRWTRDGKITFLNEFGQKFFGYSSEEILGRHVVGTIVPMTDSSGLDLGPLMDRILADPKAFERNVNENMRRDGERVWIAWTNKIVPDEQGHIAEILSIGTDITELKRAQEELRERNTELRSINRIVSAATGFLDLEAVLEDVLDEALDLVGLEGGTICLVAPNGTLELHANRATTEATVQDLSSNSVRLGDCLCGDCAHTLEPLILHDREEVLSYATRESTRGDPIHFHAAFPLVTASKCVGVLCIFTRTERKPPDQRLKLLETVTGQLALSIENAQLYEASQRHAEELERIVAERTKELAHAKERAEAADHLKSAFLANMSHELRTPLNSIIGFTGIILQGLAGPLNPEQAKQLEMVRSSSRHLLALINDVLDISKIEAGQLGVASERFDLRESINKVIGIVAPLAEKKGLALRAQIVQGLGEAVGDQRRVEQILLNLLNNAIKFTDSGEVSLKTELVRDFKLPGATSGQPAARLSISDTGIGIKSDDLTTLFQPFRQIESGLSRNYEGTGLGLAICRRLADLMGCDMSAESTWTKGSTFSFTLPLQGSSRS